MSSTPKFRKHILPLSFPPEDESNRLLRNVCISLKLHTAYQPRRQSSTRSPQTAVRTSNLNFWIFYNLKLKMQALFLLESSKVSATETGDATSSFCSVYCKSREQSMSTEGTKLNVIIIINNKRA